MTFKKTFTKEQMAEKKEVTKKKETNKSTSLSPVSYTHPRPHETVLDIECRLLLEKKTTTHCQYMHR